MLGNSSLRTLYASLVAWILVVMAPVALGQDAKPDPAWNKALKLPSAFPDIKPIDDLKDVEEFIKKQNVEILETDPLIRKLQKAKLRNALEALRMDLPARIHGSFVEHEVPLHLSNSIHDAVSTGLELAGEDKERRVWLVFAVGIWKSVELAAVNRAVGALYVQTAMNMQRNVQTAMSMQRKRLDAEIALLRHDQKK